MTDDPRETVELDELLFAWEEDARKNALVAAQEFAAAAVGAAANPLAADWTEVRQAQTLAEHWAGRALVLAELRLTAEPSAPLEEMAGPPSPEPVARPALRLVRDGEVPPVGILPEVSTPAEPAAQPVDEPDFTDRDTAIKEIRRALRARSGQAWSVRGDSGSSRGWITISSPPARRVDGEFMSDQDRATLAGLLCLTSVSRQGVEVPASGDYRVEYVDRANGRKPRVVGKQYWD